MRGELSDDEQGNIVYPCDIAYHPIDGDTPAYASAAKTHMQQYQTLSISKRGEYQVLSSDDEGDGGDDKVMHSEAPLNQHHPSQAEPSANNESSFYQGMIGQKSLLSRRDDENH